MKSCNKCMVVKSLTDFSKDKDKSDGVKTLCKSCVSLTRKWHRKESQETVRVRIRRYKQKYPEKIKAQDILRNEIRSGRMVRQPCFICGIDKAHAHHPCYALPLAITWLCHTHHREAHTTLISLSTHHK